jgi:prepilin-type N-terminal cleavage/methylation domain-containing protein/prepilin-type processing-associated H-X9-DG protein
MPVAHRRSGAGFTLIELLVVIAVIMILAAILFPVFAGARAKARQSTCLSNLNQLAKAGMLYLQDYEDRFPSCYDMREPPYAADPSVLLQPYAKNWAVFYCPERSTVLRYCLDPLHDFRPFSRCMGYGYNWGSSSGWGALRQKNDGLVRHVEGRGPVGVTLAEVAAPAHCFLFGDTDDYLFLTLQRDAMPGVRANSDPSADVNGIGLPYEPPRHAGGNLFVFVDGHVQWLRFPGGRWTDNGPWVVPDMSMYSRTGRWETGPVP